MGVDFRTVKNAVNTIIDDLDHCDLNQHPSFLDRNPSSENIAVYIYDQLAKKLIDRRYRVYSITVRETDPCGVTYYGPTAA
jgi:6-pyruvoyltetrahydropterin/6-carboxytetrahydropterin synthase